MKRSPIRRRRPIRRTSAKRASELLRKTPLAKVGKQKPKRQARYAVFMQSPEWQVIRLATFEHDGFRCTNMVTRGSLGYRLNPDLLCRCPNEDETRTGKGLQAHHKRYALRFGGNEIPGVDTTTHCSACHAQVESLLRPWNRARAWQGRQMS